MAWTIHRSRCRWQLTPRFGCVHPNRRHVPGYYKTLRIGHRAEVSEPAPGRVKNGHCYRTVIRKLIRYPRLGVERIRVVLQQPIPIRFTDAVKPHRQHRVCKVLRRHAESHRFDSTFPSGPTTCNSMASPTSTTLRRDKSAVAAAK